MSDVGGEIAENCGFEGKILCEVPQGARGCDSGDTCDTPATGYTPPEGWRVLAVGEILQAGDMWVNHEGESRPTKRVGERVNDELYIRCDPIEPEPQPEPQPPVPQDADQMIRLLSEANHNHVAMIGRLQGRINDLETIRDNQAATIEELRSEVSYVQRVLGESRQRVTHLEELVTSLRTINEAQEKSFNAANKANDDLQHRLNVVSAEWAEQTERFRRLQQPIAAACHTAQTMVRDMLGHMRCLLALYHTTERRDFCKLLESILEVFDNAECDEDEDEDTTCTTNTSEAGQG